jgi:YVTN family beta-propeller protein
VLDTRTGALLRTLPLAGEPDTLVVDERTARVFVANRGAGMVSVLDAHDGTLLRTVTIGGQPTALAVDERRGRVYVVDGGAGTLSLLDAHSGRLLCTVPVDPTPNPDYALPDALAVDAARDRVYLSTWGPLAQGPGGLTLGGPGTLWVLDARTGTVRRRLTVGVAPQAVAVDERSGRVVVVNGGGVIRAPQSWLTAWTQQARAWLPWLGRVAPAPPTPACVPGSVSVIATPA